LTIEVIVNESACIANVVDRRKTCQLSLIGPREERATVLADSSTMRPTKNYFHSLPWSKKGLLYFYYEDDTIATNAMNVIVKGRIQVATEEQVITKDIHWRVWWMNASPRDW